MAWCNSFQEFTVEDAETTRVCSACGKTEAIEGVKLKACYGCKRAYYCSKACAKEDWKRGHKELCTRKCPCGKATCNHGDRMPTKGKTPWGHKTKSGKKSGKKKGGIGKDGMQDPDDVD